MSCLGICNLGAGYSLIRCLSVTISTRHPLVWVLTSLLVTMELMTLPSLDRRACRPESNMVQQSTRGHRPGRSRGSSPLLINGIVERLVGECEVLVIDLQN